MKGSVDVRIAETRTFFVSVIGSIAALASIATVFYIGEVTRYSAWMSPFVLPLLALFFLGTFASLGTGSYLLLTGMSASAWKKGIVVLVLILDLAMAIVYIEFQRGIPFEEIPEDILKQVLIARAPHLHSWSADVQQFTRYEIQHDQGGCGVRPAPRPHSSLDRLGSASS